MKITILGCGNAFSHQNFNQLFLLEEDGRKMLIDCGYQALASLDHAGVKIEDINDVYISHIHADHIGGMEYMAFSRYDWITQPRPENARDFKYGKAPNLLCESHLMKDLWNKSLRGGLESMEGFLATLDTFFICKELDINKQYLWQGWKMNLVQQIHVMSGSGIMWAFGLFFEKEGHPKIYFTTDSQHCSPAQVEVFYKKADIIFQDCEIVPIFSNVHANYIQLAGYPDANSRKLPKDIKKKMKLSHYQDIYSQKKKMVVKNSPYEFYRGSSDQAEMMSTVDFDWDEVAKKDGFDEFIKVGNVYEF